MQTSMDQETSLQLLFTDVGFVCSAKMGKLKSGPLEDTLNPTNIDVLPGNFNFISFFIHFEIAAAFWLFDKFRGNFHADNTSIVYAYYMKSIHLYRASLYSLWAGNDNCVASEYSFSAQKIFFNHASAYDD